MTMLNIIAVAPRRQRPLLSSRVRRSSGYKFGVDCAKTLPLMATGARRLANSRTPAPALPPHVGREAVQVGVHGLGEPVRACQTVGHHHQRHRVDQGIPGAGIPGDVLPRHHVQGQHQRHRQQADHGCIQQFAGEHPPTNAEHHQAEQGVFLAGQHAHFAQRGIGLAGHLAAVGHARLVNSVRHQRQIFTTGNIVLPSCTGNVGRCQRRQQNVNDYHRVTQHQGPLAHKLHREQRYAAPAGRPRRPARR